MEPLLGDCVVRPDDRNPIRTTGACTGTDSDRRRHTYSGPPTRHIIVANLKLKIARTRRTGQGWDVYHDPVDPAGVAGVVGERRRPARQQRRFVRCDRRVVCGVGGWVVPVERRAVVEHVPPDHGAHQLIGSHVQPAVVGAGDAVIIDCYAHAVQAEEQIRVPGEVRLGGGADCGASLGDVQIAVGWVGQQWIGLRAAQSLPGKRRLELGKVVNGRRAGPLDTGRAAGIVQHIVVHRRGRGHAASRDAYMVGRLGEVRDYIVVDVMRLRPAAGGGEARIHVVYGITRDVQLRRRPGNHARPARPDVAGVIGVNRVMMHVVYEVSQDKRAYRAVAPHAVGGIVDVVMDHPHVDRIAMDHHGRAVRPGCGEVAGDVSVHFVLGDDNIAA